MRQQQPEHGWHVSAAGTRRPRPRRPRLGDHVLERRQQRRSRAAITTNWEAFFNAKTPDSKRVRLLQDGSQFATVIKSQSGSGLAALATAKVTHVTVNSPTQATVTYDILVSGTPELKNQTGTAVLENGTWKVGVRSFCGLLTLENAGKTSGLPAACKSAS